MLWLQEHESLAPTQTGVPARNGPDLGREIGTFQFKGKGKKNNIVTIQYCTAVTGKRCKGALGIEIAQ
jgi:hypothetical protein